MHAVLLLFALAVPRQNMLLFDLTWVVPRDLQRVQRTVADRVERSGEDEVFGVALYSDVSGVKVLVPFTSDRARVVGVVGRLRSGLDERMANAQIVGEERPRAIGRFAESLASVPGEKRVVYILPRSSMLSNAYPRAFANPASPFDVSPIYTTTQQPAIGWRQMMKQFADAGVRFERMQ